MGTSPGLVKPDVQARIVRDASRRPSGVVAGVVNQPSPPSFPPPSRNYEFALGLVDWCQGQEKIVEPNYVRRVWAAAIAACLNAKAEKVDRLIWRLEDQGYPR